MTKKLRTSLKKEIYYWSPFLGRVATIRSVINSMIGLKRYNGKDFNINLINCYGEWNGFRSRLKHEKINTLDLQKKFNVDINLHGFFFFKINLFIYTHSFLQKIKNFAEKK